MTKSNKTEKNNIENDDNMIVEKVVDADKAAAEAVAKSVYGDKKKSFSKKKKIEKKKERTDEFEQRIIDLARVTRVMAGGKRMRFRACVAIGDKNGKIGIGLAKGADVTIAISKAVNQAKKVVIDVPIVNETIPHDVKKKTGAAVILLKPAKLGRGVIAGGAARMILELAGIKNITSKILGTSNKVSIARNTIEALASLRKVESKTPKTQEVSEEKKDTKNKEEEKSKEEVKKNKK